MAGGGDTNKGRKSGEEVIIACFRARGIQVEKYRDWNRLTNRNKVLDGVVVVQGYPYTTLYQTTGYLDFLILRDGVPQTAFEVKHQGVPGSVDEKLPYIILNGLERWPTDHGILVLSGDHWQSPRGEAIMTSMRKLSTSLQASVKHFEIYDMTQITNWISRIF